MLFKVKDKSKNEIEMEFDDVDFLVETTRLSFPRLCSGESHPDNPEWLRSIQLEFVKLIDALVIAFDKEFNTSFSKGAINKLFNKLYEYKSSLKKNIQDEQQSFPSPTDSTAATSTETSTTTSSAN